MEFKKCIIEYSSHSETLYCINTEVADYKNYILLGFKDSIPVISDNKMPNNKANTHSNIKNKVLKVEIDHQTGEKFINLNGRKIKIPESKSSSQKAAQIIPGQQPVKFKIIRGFPLSKSNSQYKSLTSEEIKIVDSDGTISKQIINLHSLSQKTLITGCELHTVKSQVSSNMAIKLATNMMCDSGSSIHSAKLFASESNKTITKSEQHVGALDLTNYSVKQNHIEYSKSTSEKSCQTDLNWYSNVRGNAVDCGVQTEELLDPFNSDFNVDLESILKDLGELADPNLPSEKNMNFTPLYASSEKLFQLDSSSQNSQENLTVCKSDRLAHTTNIFFKEMRTALLSDDKGNMPIHVGVLCNDLKTVKKRGLILKILEQSVDLPNNSDLTPLQLAVTHTVSSEIIDYLLGRGASLGVTDEEGNNILHLAVEYQRTDVLSIILQCARERYFNLDQHNHEGLTPLMIACINGQQDCAKLLLDFKADVNARDLISGRTSLFHAAENLDVEMVQTLLNYNAETKLKNFFGTSPHDAMYEIDDIPDQIKTLILSKNKRKAAEEPKPAKSRKKEEPVVLKVKGLKTFPKYEKIAYAEGARRLNVVK